MRVGLYPCLTHFLPSLPVICIGMFDKDLRPATLLAVPELYTTGRMYKAFNLKVFLSYMVLAAMQSVGISFLAYFSWGIFCDER